MRNVKLAPALLEKEAEEAAEKWATKKGGGWAWHGKTWHWVWGSHKGQTESKGAQCQCQQAWQGARRNGVMRGR